MLQLVYGWSTTVEAARERDVHIIRKPAGHAVEQDEVGLACYQAAGPLDLHAARKAALMARVDSVVTACLLACRGLG